MSAVPLNNELKKLDTIAKSDVGYKQQALNAISATASSITNSVVAAASTLINSTIQAITAPINDLISTFNSAVAQVKSTYYSITSKFTASSQPVSTEDPANPVTAVIPKTTSLPRSNDKSAINGDLTQIIAIDDAKTQNPDKIVEAITSMNNTMNQDGISEVREKRRNYKYVNPFVDLYTEQLEWFKPISEYIGSSIIAYTPDTSSLPFAFWDKSQQSTVNAPVAIRRNTSNKLNKEQLKNIENAYVNLNKRMVKNISTQTINKSTKTLPLNVAHSYNLNGDYTFYNDHIKDNEDTTNATSFELAKQVTSIVNQVLGEQITLLNYIVPIENETIVSGDNYSLPVNNGEITVNRKGDKLIAPFETVNNSSLLPVVET